MPTDVIGEVFKRFIFPTGKIELIARIAEKLVAIDTGKTEVAAIENVTKALRRLLADNKLVLPKDAVSKDDFKDSFLDEARKAIDSALDDSGQSKLGIASKVAAGAIKFLNTSFDRCGGNDVAKPPKGPPIEQKNGRHVIVYCVEEDQQKNPLLPAINNNPKFARGRLTSAFEGWEGFLDVDIVRTGDPTSANLLVTGRTFGPEVDDSVLALTDIGPPNGVQLRMVFDLAETTLTPQEFTATAAHELGHALGIRHQDVRESRQLMNALLSDISEPGDGDLRAAVAKGWIRS